MPRRPAISAFFFLLGAGVFAWLVVSFGVGEIAAQIGVGGWNLLLAVLIWFVIYVLNTAAWKLALGENGQGIGAAELFMITVSGFVINYITPVVALGGEPYKADALARALGTQKAISSVVLYRMVHLLGHMFLLLAGIAAAFLFVPLDPAVASGLAVAAAVIALVIFLALNGTRDGIFDRIGRFVGRYRILRFAARPLARYRDDLGEMDRVLTHVYRNDRASFAGSVALEFLGRVLMGVEVFVVLRALGYAPTLPQALYIYVMYSIVINMFFFIPMNVGAREGGILLGMEGMSADALAGVSVGVILRIREFVWIAIGLAFTLVIPRMRRAGRGDAGGPGG